MKKTLTGKRYLPLDNSYNANLSKESKTNDSIAGSRWTDPIETTIKTEPFEITNERGKTLMYVIVDDQKGQSHLTLFFDFRIIKDDAHKESLILGDKDSFIDHPYSY